MVIKIKENKAVLDHVSYNNFIDWVFYGAIVLLLIYAFSTFKKELYPFFIGMFAMVAVFVLFIVWASKKFPKAAEKAGFKKTVYLDKNKNIICSANWGIGKNKEFMIKRSDNPVLIWKGFWRAQTLFIKAKNYQKNAETRKLFPLFTSASRYGFRYKKEEVRELAKFLDISLEGSSSLLN